MLIQAVQRDGRFSCRVLTPWGDKDWTNQRDRSGVEAAILSPEVITLDQTGHFSALERPQAWADIILARTASLKVSAVR